VGSKGWDLICEGDLRSRCETLTIQIRICRHTGADSLTGDRLGRFNLTIKVGWWGADG